MDVGLALPTMTDGWTRQTWLDWCRVIDDGPFSSISCGERITFKNTEMLTTLAAAAALTERVRVMVNLAIAPWHAPALLAKQLATIDVVSNGRLDVGLGVGGREQDYAAVGSPMARRHQRLDDTVAELQRLWAGEPPVGGAPPLGPPVVQAGGPPLYAGATGPKATARAARWAVGISGFSLNLDLTEIDKAATLAHSVWADQGRTDPPKIVMGCFAVVGTPEAAADLARFTADYIRVFGDKVASQWSSSVTLHSADALTDALNAVGDQGLVDEVIVVPGSVDPSCATAVAHAVASSTT